MNTKTTFSLIIFAITGLFLYSFVLPFKEMAVDTVSDQSEKMAGAYDQATKQLSLKALRIKRQQLGTNEVELLKNFIPTQLNSGHFAYNMGQLANQNRLTLKSIQYTTIESQVDKNSKEKKVAVEMSLDGRYEDFIGWVRLLEKSNMLIDFDYIRAGKVGNASDIINFNIKVYAYGINID